ncbi:MAG: transcription termination factor NusA [Hyphomicrobiales bacterium]
MNGPEMLRLVDSISRDRNIDKEVLFQDLEQAMVSAARKHFNALDTDEFHAEIDRMNGQIRVWHNQEEVPLESLGRIPAQTAKQVMIQRFREDERESIYNEFIDRVGDLVTGMAQRYEGGALVVQVGRAEGFMPRSEQIPGEQHQPGERVRCLILDVRDRDREDKPLSQVKIVLSRGAPDFIRRLFEVEVPEVAERIIEIKAMAREPGHRTKIAVSSIDSKVDAVGACVGVRGSRIKNIVDELGGEKIDIVRWNESSQILIQNALKPAEIAEISLCFELGRATVVVNEDQLSLAIGKRGQNVRLAARLTNWDVDILTPQEYTKSLDTMEETLKTLDAVTEDHIDRLAALGVISVFDVEEVGVDYLAETLEVDAETAQHIINVAAEKAKVVAEEQQREKAEAEKRRAEEAAQPGEQQAAAILGGGGPSGAQGGGGEGEQEGDIVSMLEQRQSEGEGDQPRDEAVAEQAAESGETTAETAQTPDVEAEQPTPDPWEPGQAQPSGSDPNAVEMTEAEQEGSPAQSLADQTPSDAGTMADRPSDAAEQRQAQDTHAGGSVEDSPATREGEDPDAAQAEVQPEPEEAQRRDDAGA